MLDEFGPLGFNAPGAVGGKNMDIAAPRLRFLDVHGDEWTAWFGPDVHDAYIELSAANDSLWTPRRIDLVPDVPPHRQSRLESPPRD